MNKKPRVMIALLLGTALVASANAADKNHWTAFGMASDADPEQTGVGGGISAQWEWQDDVYFKGQVLAGTYDDFERAQVLFGGEWVDRVGKVNGYVGASVGVDAISADAYDSEDVFGRIHYELGWKVSRSSELRLGIAYDVKSEAFDRQGGARIAWYSGNGDEFNFFIRGELYQNEKNVFAGLSWPF